MHPMLKRYYITFISLDLRWNSMEHYHYYGLTHSAVIPIKNKMNHCDLLCIHVWGFPAYFFYTKFQNYLKSRSGIDDHDS